MFKVWSQVVPSKSNVMFDNHSRSWKKVFGVLRSEYIVGKASEVSDKIIKIQDLIYSTFSFSSEKTFVMFCHDLMLDRVQVQPDINSKIDSTLSFSGTLEEATNKCMIMISVSVKKFKVQSPIKLDQKEIDTLKIIKYLIGIPYDVTFGRVLPNYWIFEVDIVPDECFNKLKEGYCIGSDLQEDFEIFVQHMKISSTRFSHTCSH